MISVRLDEQRYSVPQDWSEVPSEHLPRLLLLTHFETPTGDTQLAIIREALRIPGNAWRKLMQAHFGPHLSDAQRQANAVVLHDLSRLLAWMQEAPIEKRPFPYLLIEPIANQAVLGDSVAYWLPDEDFMTMSYGELIDAYVHFMAFTGQLVPGDKHLNLLVATLCRRPYDPGGSDYPHDWNGDHREPYNEFSAALNEQVMARVPEGERMAVLLYFAGNLKRLFDRYKTYGGGSGAADEYPGQSMLQNAYLLAEKGIFGNMSQTKATNVHDVMLCLEEQRAALLARIEAEKQNAHD